MKITDKRKFTPDGELRQEYRASQPDEELDPAVEVKAAESEAESAVAPNPSTAVEPEAPSISAAPVPPPAETPAEEAFTPPPDLGELGPPEFMELLEMLLQPALIYLGDLPLPDGQPSENLPLARRQIDLLRVLKAKTAGNLSSQESSVMEDLLYRLQLRYVQKTS